MLVYYPRGFSEVRWRRAHERGERPEASHWGMHHARELGFDVTSSEDFEPGPLLNFLHRLGHRLLRVDLAHVVANFARVREADEIWAMTERELIMLVLATRFLKRRPVLVSEAVWMLDEWPRYGWFRRNVVRWCLKRTDAMMVCVEGGAEALRRIAPGLHVVAYRFGVPVEAYRPLREKPGLSPGFKPDRPLRVLSAGNDMRRDWPSVIDAVADRLEYETVLLSRRDHVRQLAQDHANLRYEPAATFEKLSDWYRWADVFVAPSAENLHGAGLTMLLEAAASGVPVITARTGFLEEYFAEDAAWLVPAGDGAAIRSALEEIRHNPDEAARRAARSRSRIEECDSAQAVAARCSVLQEASYRAMARHDGQGSAERSMSC
ncbi:MAG: glycosyltransferase [Geminicoccaceae bacterium]|nr:glycosyltransferase [Geminicoccaceae bacterium]